MRLIPSASPPYTPRQIHPFWMRGNYGLQGSSLMSCRFAPSSTIPVGNPCEPRSVSSLFSRSVGLLIPWLTAHASLCHSHPIQDHRLHIGLRPFAEILMLRIPSAAPSTGFRFATRRRCLPIPDGGLSVSALLPVFCGRFAFRSGDVQLTDLSSSLVTGHYYSFHTFFSTVFYSRISSKPPKQ
jgi:hypothetical protein